MKHWAWAVVALYGFAIVALTWPVTMLAFIGEIDPRDPFEAFIWPGYWIWLAVMLLGQAGLLTVPVKVASRRPVSRRSILFPIVACGLMMGGLAWGAALSIDELLEGEAALEGGPELIFWGTCAIGLVTWIAWSVVFFRLSRDTKPSDIVTSQCRILLSGSILELLVAVPTHVVARYKDYCCAGFMSFVGITMGLSVMLFSFGPGVFFLFVRRWRRLHPGGAKDSS
jgi:hypothetical protein